MAKSDFQKCEHICFVNPDVGKLIEKDRGVPGGAETQILLFSKSISRLGRKVSIVTSFKNYGKTFKNEGIYWYGTTFRYLGGSNIYLFQDWLRLARLILGLHPDVVILKHPRHLVGFLGFLCAVFGMKLFFHAAIDKDVNPDKIKNEPYMAVWLYRLGLRFVTGILAQTQTQKRLMSKLTHRPVHHLPSIFREIPMGIALPRSNDPIILWVGSNSARKRPQIFIEAAEKLPTLKFVMIISPGDGTGALGNISFPENLTIIESCPRQEMGMHYRRSVFVVSTSFLEGFPNIFLESWGFGKPVVSLEVDPDSVIRRYRLGLVADTKETLFDCIQQMSTEKRLRDRLGKNGRRYIEKWHRPETVLPTLLNIVDNAGSARTKWL